MGDGDHVLSVALDVIRLDILACPPVKQIFQVCILVRDGACQGPHGIPQANGRALARRAAHARSVSLNVWRRGKTTVNVQVHGGQVPVLVDHGDGRVNLFKVDLVKLVDRLLWRQGLLEAQTDHLPGKCAADIVHAAHAHAGIEVEVLDGARLGRLAIEVPSIHIAITRQAHGRIRNAKVGGRRRLRRRGHGDVEGLWHIGGRLLGL